MGVIRPAYAASPECYRRLLPPYLPASVARKLRKSLESIRLHEAAGNPWMSFYPLAGMGYACLKLHEYDQARQHFLEAQRLADEWGNSWAMADIRYMLGATELGQGNTDGALDYCQASLRLAAQLPDNNIIAHCLGLAAGIVARQGQPARAARLSGAAQALYARQGRKPWEDWSLDTLLPGWREGPDQAAILQAFEAGQAMQAEQAVADVLSDP